MIECPKCKSFNILINDSYEFYDLFECNICKYWTYKRIEDCCRNPLEIITIDRKNHDLYFLYKQCLNCGGSTNRTRPLSSKKFGDEIRGEFDYGSFEKWKENRDLEYNELSIVKKNFNYFNSPYYKYCEYLNSQEWKDKRDLALKRDNFKCQKCKIKVADDVHHLTYENLGNEKLSELLSVCRECHIEIHKKK
nr:hypothetical protein [uncultured Draconibacterium sp.]